ncbi:hypothetical protein BSL78_14127 [Apostichopus japonicus]|uniref:Reverse transcriptase domain-containing protein n=1 Tax=Stichopus japonicus TaxID=307972 RepID=A0A2G8KLY4_STIJA|nr:hypothetical protein BSL78_14127 [Apostichopus japonicus]
MLAAELLMRHHQQLPEDKDQIPDRQASQILWLLGPLARLIYHQFASSLGYLSGATAGATPRPQTTDVAGLVDHPHRDTDKNGDGDGDRKERLGHGTHPDSQQHDEARPDLTHVVLSHLDPPSVPGARDGRGETSTIHPAMGTSGSGLLAIGGDFNWVPHRIRRYTPLTSRRQREENHPNPQDPDQSCALETEIQALLDKVAVVRTTGREGPLFCSSFFLTPKKDKSLRLILNLRQLNKAVIKPKHFRMETLSIIIQSLNKGMWASTVDLKESYLHIPIHPKHQLILAFSYGGTDFKFTALPFGLSTPPRVFTRVAGVAVKELCCRRIPLFVCLDDWLVLGDSYREARRNVALLFELIPLTCTGSSALQCKLTVVHNITCTPPPFLRVGASLMISRARMRFFAALGSPLGATHPPYPNAGQATCLCPGKDSEGGVSGRCLRSQCAVLKYSKCVVSKSPNHILRFTKITIDNGGGDVLLGQRFTTALAMTASALR